MFGCAGQELSEDERRFFGKADPLGFILFARNIADPRQVSGLVEALRQSVGRRAPVLIDQEGGRVQRLRPPFWRAAPPAARFGMLARLDGAAAERAAWLNARLIALELTALGIDVDCAPVLDNPVPGAHDVIGDRAFSLEPGVIARLGRATIDGLMAGGVLPVVKHIPGHGRAEADSHVACPVVRASAGDLARSDLPPFRALADAPIAMTAHVVYAAWDGTRPATLSPTVIRDVIRGEIGFDGVLLSDDLSMQALSGGLDERAAAALAAGCDVVLHCNGRLDEMRAVAGAAGRLEGPALDRVARALKARRRPDLVDRPRLLAELGELLRVAA